MTGEPVVGTLLVLGVALVVAPIAVLVVAPPLVVERAVHRAWCAWRRR